MRFIIIALTAEEVHNLSIILTGQHSRHECSKHEEEHREEEKSSVVKHPAGIIANVEIEQTY